MKKKALMSLLVAVGIALSTYGTVLASVADNGRFNSDGGKFKWEYIAENKRVDVYSDNTSYPVDKNYTAYASEVQHMSVNNLSEKTNYIYSGFFDGMDKLESIIVTGECSRLNICEKCPNLKRLYMYNNTRNWTYVDLSGRTSSTLPQLITDTKTEYCLYFNKYAGSSTLTVPKYYGNNERLSYSFINSSKLTAVSFEDGTEIISEDAFYNCENIKSVTIPAGVTDIEYSAFRNCTNLTSISLPASLKTLRFNAFTDSGIKEINYSGTRMKWYGLVQVYDEDGPVQGENVLHLDRCVVHCADGDILIQKNGTKYIQNSYGWVRENGAWYYFYENGAIPYDHIAEINGKSYGFDEDGKMVTGWGKFNDNWYFFDRSSGAMATGWLKDGGNWYYMYSNGVMATGWVKVGGYWYYLKPDSGAMAKGWLKDGSAWYYLKPDGSMASSEFCEGYWLNANGTWTYPYHATWRINDTGWWYGDESGWYAKSRTYKIDGIYYTFNSAGYWIEG